MGAKKYNIPSGNRLNRIILARIVLSGRKKRGTQLWQKEDGLQVKLALKSQSTILKHLG